MRVEQLMTTNVGTCNPADDLSRAAQIMWEQDCGCVPVVVQRDGGVSQLVGMLTDRDICMAAYTKGLPLQEIPVSSVMSKNVCSCRRTDPISVAQTVLRTNQLRRLPVVDGEDELGGLLAIADLARESARQTSSGREVTAEEIGQTVEAVSRPVRRRVSWYELCFTRQSTGCSTRKPSGEGSSPASPR